MYKLLLALSLLLPLAHCRPQSYEDSHERLGYSFGYEISDEDSDENPLHFGHAEGRSDESDTTSGSYYVLLPDSRTLRVEYYVDENGFHPTVTYEGEAVYPESEEYSK